MLLLGLKVKELSAKVQKSKNKKIQKSKISNHQFYTPTSFVPKRHLVNRLFPDLIFSLSIIVITSHNVQLAPNRSLNPIQQPKTTQIHINTIWPHPPSPPISSHHKPSVNNNYPDHNQSHEPFSQPPPSSTTTPKQPIHTSPYRPPFDITTMSKPRQRDIQTIYAVCF